MKDSKRFQNILKRFQNVSQDSNDFKRLQKILLKNSKYYKNFERFQKSSYYSLQQKA